MFTKGVLTGISPIDVGIKLYIEKGEEWMVKPLLEY
jgi:hypothetical protein